MHTFNVPAKETVSPANQAIFDNLGKALGFVRNLYAVKLAILMNVISAVF